MGMMVIGRCVVPVCDVAAALSIATAQGYDPRAMAWLIPAIADGAAAGAAERLEDAGRER